MPRHRFCASMPTLQAIASTPCRLTAQLSRCGCGWSRRPTRGVGGIDRHPARGRAVEEGQLLGQAVGAVGDRRSRRVLSDNTHSLHSVLSLAVSATAGRRLSPPAVTPIATGRHILSVPPRISCRCRPATGRPTGRRQGFLVTITRDPQAHFFFGQSGIGTDRLLSDSSPNVRLITSVIRPWEMPIRCLCHSTCPCAARADRTA